MSKGYIAFLSAAILGLYGIVTSKWAFVGLGATFAIIGIAEYLKQKNKIGK